MRDTNWTCPIEAAQARGSQATTRRGAINYLRKHIYARSVFGGQQISRYATLGREYGWMSRQTREAWAQKQHDRRLCARYVGLKRLPRYLSAADRATIAAHPANREYKMLVALPVYARSFYANHVRDIARFAPFVREFERERGLKTYLSRIADDAHDRYPWGRLQVHETGECVHPDFARMRETGSNTDWNKRSTLRRFADYCLIAPTAIHGNVTMYYHSTDGSRHLVFASQNYLKVDDWEKPLHNYQSLYPRKYVHTTHIQRRILAPHVPAVLNVEYDRDAKKLMLVDGWGEQYHLNQVTDSANARSQVREAVTGLRKRRAQKIAVTNPETVWVTVEDSYNAGNCRAMTDSFVAEYLAKIGAGGPVSTRGDLLLSIRDDSYTRRAVAQAAQREIGAH